MNLEKILELLKSAYQKIDDGLYEDTVKETEKAVAEGMEDILEVIRALELSIEFGITEEDLEDE